jgi:integrase
MVAFYVADVGRAAFRLHSEQLLEVDRRALGFQLCGTLLGRLHQRVLRRRHSPTRHREFPNWFREVCNEAELPKRCTSHGLRKAAATYFADRGATTTQLMAWFGWKTASEAERYTRGADRKRNAAAAGELVSGTGIGKPEIQFAKTPHKSLKSRKAKT